MRKKTPPPRLFKYQPYNVQTLDNLKKRVIWLSVPASFNDPFDLSIRSLPAEPTENEWQLFAKEQMEAHVKYHPGEDAHWQELYLTDGKPNKEFKQMMFNSSNVVMNWVRQVNRTRGVACFSEKVDDILMWAHYAEGHRGFCLEFDTSFAPFEAALKVVYSKRYPSLRLADPAVGYESATQPLLITKSTHWKYEKEWRILVREGNQGFEVDPACLTGIYFGCAMPDEHASIIAMILRGSSTQLNEMKRSETEFKVEPRLIISPESLRKKRVDPLDAPVKKNWLPPPLSDLPKTSK